MNCLETYLAESDLPPGEAMNRLQDAGVVSDLAVHPADVARPDDLRAVKFLLRASPIP